MPDRFVKDYEFEVVWDGAHRGANADLLMPLERPPKPAADNGAWRKRRPGVPVVKDAKNQTPVPVAREIAANKAVSSNGF
jgi:hypothetical protein